MPDFDPRPLNLVDEHLRAMQLSRAGHERVLTRLRSSSEPRTRQATFVLSGLLAVAAAVAGMFWIRTPTPVPESWALGPDCSTSSLAGGATHIEGGCAFTIENAPTQTSLALQVWDNAVFAPSARGVSLMDGSASFSVEPVATGGPTVEIGVPFGRIEVLGTRFAVRAMPSGGEVALYEGIIRFTHASGRAHVLRPGQSLTWDGASFQETTVRPEGEVSEREARPPERVHIEDGTEGLILSESVDPETGTEKPEPVASAKTRVKTPRRAAVASLPTLDEQLMMVERLRQTGRFREALDQLSELERHTSASDPRDAKRTREVLSFERGTLLEQIDEGRACRHWKAHARRFPGGMYGDAVVRRRSRCLGR